MKTNCFLDEEDGPKTSSARLSSWLAGTKVMKGMLQKLPSPRAFVDIFCTTQGIQIIHSWDYHDG